MMPAQKETYLKTTTDSSSSGCKQTKKQGCQSRWQVAKPETSQTVPGRTSKSEFSLSLSLSFSVVSVFSPTDFHLHGKFLSGMCLSNEEGFNCSAKINSTHLKIKAFFPLCSFARCTFLRPSTQPSPNLQSRVTGTMPVTGDYGGLLSFAE